MNRPCKDSKHEFVTTRDYIACSKCPIEVRRATVPDNLLGRAWVAAERDWYIKELES